MNFAPTYLCPHCGQPRDTLDGAHIDTDDVACAPEPDPAIAEERAATIAHLGEHCLMQPGDCAGMTNLRRLLAQAVDLLAKEAS